MASNAKNLAELLNQDSTVAVGDIADGSVTTAKLAADAVTAAKLADNAVVTANITDGAVTAVKSTGVGKNKNLIINGGLEIDQRHEYGVTAQGNGSDYLGDRLNIEGLSGGGGANMQIVSDSPDALPNMRSAKVTVTSTDTSLAGGDYYTLRHIIEGVNCKHLGFGTSNAKTCTLSFYVKSSLTGTFCIAVGNGANNRGRPYEYTINSANTWEKKTIVVTGDTSGTYETGTGRGIIIRWCMGAGADRQSAVGSYSANEVHASSNQTNLFATNGATFQIAALQFEEGSNATDFERLSIGEDLYLCQRYFWILDDKGAGSNDTLLAWGRPEASNELIFWIPYPCEMRATPSINVNGSTSDVYANSVSNIGTYTSQSLLWPNRLRAALHWQGVSSVNTSYSYDMVTTSGRTWEVEFRAEL